ncbi:hypothetical protein C4B63_32g209 [Trypanosoma cruzi]|uniref:Uncharacterized protein n=1 Tax=Trypanosoma cruzi TaxID=5693 RepID=A0A2V2VDY8_TRYCR|nr:hypothetical protein C4B63_32g209 [Trypanosoma cruzi]
MVRQSRLSRVQSCCCCCSLFLSYSFFFLCSLIYVYVCVFTFCCCCYGFFSVKAKERGAIAHRENIYINKRSINKNKKKKEVLKKMTISEKKCLFIRVALYLLFIAAYAAGVVVFIISFSNYWAAAGFFLACIFIAITTVLYVVPDKKLTARLPPGSLSRIIFQSTILIGTLGFFAVALYLLARALC